MMKRTHFLWGVATSPYQVEGRTTKNDWDFFTRSQRIRNRIFSLMRIHQGIGQPVLQPAGEAARAWDPKYYSKDFDNAAMLGMNCFRIGLEWAHIEPEKNEFDNNAINHYKEMIAQMLERGLNPVVTLNHICLPLWVSTPPSEFTRNIDQNSLPEPLNDLRLTHPSSADPYWRSLRGWENYETVEEFTKFVQKVVREFKEQVDYWITLTEPVASVIGNGYIAGLWPPGFFLDGNRAKEVLHNLIEAHVRAYDTITDLDDVDSDGDGLPKLVGVSHSMVVANAAKPSISTGHQIEKNTEACKNFDYFINDYFINAVVNGEEDLNYLNTLERYNENSKDFIKCTSWQNKVDFIGLNCYSRAYVYCSDMLSESSARFVGGLLVNNLHEQFQQPHGTVNDLGWEIYPEGLYKLIMKIKNQWGKPVFVTENGLADKSDRYRAPFIVAHIQQIKRAIEEGANVIGYLHWSLIDNYEWLQGYREEAKFGLFYIDRSDKEFNRQITRGALALKLLIEESHSKNKDGLPSDNAIMKAIDKYGTFTPDGMNIMLPHQT
jgi:beta-glucosidase